MDSIKLRISGTVNDSIVDGEGFRYTIFTQGCPHNCPGCHNPQTHSFSGGYMSDIQTLLKEILSNPLLSGVTFSGGEPFCQPEALVVLAKTLHEHQLDIWCYTGYTYETLLKEADPQKMALLREVDYLVDGPYIEAQRDLTIDFRGSRNQRIIDVKASLNHNRIVFYTP